MTDVDCDAGRRWRSPGWRGPNAPALLRVVFAGTGEPCAAPTPGIDVRDSPQCGERCGGKVAGDVVHVAELPDGLMIVSVLTPSQQPIYQVRDGEDVLAEHATLAEVFDDLNARE